MADVEGDDDAVSDADESEVKPGVRGSWWFPSGSGSILDGIIWSVEGIFAPKIRCREKKEDDGLVWKESLQQLLVF